MSYSEEVTNKARVEGKLPPAFLKLGEQILDEKGNKKGVKSLGPIKVKFLGDKERDGQDMFTKEDRKEVAYLFEIDGIKYRYYVSLYSKDKETKKYTDELNYFVVKMGEYKTGDELILEMKKSGVYSFIDIQKAGESEPTVDADTGDISGTNESQDIPTEEEELSAEEVIGDEPPF